MTVTQGATKSGHILAEELEDEREDLEADTHTHTHTHTHNPTPKPRWVGESTSADGRDIVGVRCSLVTAKAPQKHRTDLLLDLPKTMV